MRIQSSTKWLGHKFETTYRLKDVENFIVLYSWNPECSDEEFIAELNKVHETELFREFWLRCEGEYYKKWWDENVAKTELEALNMFPEAKEIVDAKYSNKTGGGFTQQELENAKHKPIVGVVSSFMELRQSTSNRFTGKCPFHNEKTGSFTVYLDTNSYHCFGCNESGDVMDFVQKTQGISLVEAVKQLQ